MIKVLHLNTLADSKGEAILSLLSDIRHFCDAEDIDFATYDKKAYEMYLREKQL